MIYITGDCHRCFERLNTRNFPEQKKLTKEDYVIICGDFGGVLDKDKESKEETHLMNWLEQKTFTTLFVDGNHENFDRLYTYPIEVWNGGKVHKIRPSVIHLMRGQVFLINGKKIFAFGGAASHDITDGILQLEDPQYKSKKKRLDMIHGEYRTEHLDWWRQELPSEEELQEGLQMLEQCGNQVDFIVSHCCATATQDKLRLMNARVLLPDILTDYFEVLKQKVRFEKWFFGHYHNNQNVTDKEFLLYEQIIRIL